MSAKQLLTDAGLHESHWGKRIIAAEVRGEFLIKDRYDSGAWQSCACGNGRLDTCERERDGRPVDWTLSRLGESFALAVCGYKCPFSAAQTLIDIEKRAQELAGVK